MAGAPETTGIMHSTPHHATTAVCNTHPLTYTLGDTLIGTLQIDTVVTIPYYDTSCQSNSHDYYMDCSWSSSKQSYDTAHRLHTWKASKLHLWKAIPHGPQHQKRLTIQNSQTDSSSESDDDSDPLNY